MSETERNTLSKADIVIYQYGTGSLPRLLDAINMFRKKYGHWPTKVNVQNGMLDAIKNEILSPLGWKMLEESITLVGINEGKVIASDDSQNEYEYDAKHITPASNEESADYWIWGCEVWPKSD
jgi:hypothetical protein